MAAPKIFFRNGVLLGTPNGAVVDFAGEPTQIAQDATAQANDTTLLAFNYPESTTVWALNAPGAWDLDESGILRRFALRPDNGTVTDNGDPVPDFMELEIAYQLDGDYGQWFGNAITINGKTATWVSNRYQSTQSLGAGRVEVLPVGDSYGLNYSGDPPFQPFPLTLDGYVEDVAADQYLFARLGYSAGAWRVIPETIDGPYVLSTDELYAGPSPITITVTNAVPYGVIPGFYPSTITVPTGQVLTEWANGWKFEEGDVHIFVYGGPQNPFNGTLLPPGQECVEVSATFDGGVTFFDCYYIYDGVGATFIPNPSTFDISSNTFGGLKPWVGFKFSDGSAYGGGVPEGYPERIQFSGHILTWEDNPEICIIDASSGYAGGWTFGNPVHSFGDDISNLEDAACVILHPDLAYSCDLTVGRTLGVLTQVSHTGMNLLDDLALEVIDPYDGSWGYNDSEFGRTISLTEPPPDGWPAPPWLGTDFLIPEEESGGSEDDLDQAELTRSKGFKAEEGFRPENGFRRRYGFTKANGF